MNYYPFHIGDYAAHTAHLDLLEDLAYRRMLDLYYIRECALPDDLDEIARLIRMRKNVAEIRAVLREFFTHSEGDGYIHMRCEEEVRRMQDKQAKARESAKASHSARRANAERTHSERNSERKADALQESSEGFATNTNTNTNTNNSPTESEPRARSSQKAQHPPEGVDPKVWSDWLQVRKGKRAGPVTDTAWSGLVREAAKAGITAEAAVRACCEFGWQGFNAGWYAQRKPPTSTGAPVALSFAERETARKAARYAEMTGGLIGQAAPPPAPGDFIDMEPTDGAARLLG